MKDRSSIETLIPQRDPFLFVDSIIEREENKILTAYFVTGDEPFFQGHFPGNPVMPGVLLQEALFQTAALLMSSESNDPQSFGVVTKVSQARFKEMVRPGVELLMEVEKLDQLENAFYFKGKTKVNQKVVALVEFTCALVKGS
jgi:3-hydroxyacyl-[acyl-carrier-protein] dehydratase